jgi:hypothetical protein
LACYWAVATAVCSAEKRVDGKADSKVGSTVEHLGPKLAAGSARNLVETWADLWAMRRAGVWAECSAASSADRMDGQMVGKSAASLGNYWVAQSDDERAACWAA